MTPEEAAAAAAKDDELKTTPDVDVPAADQQPPATDSPGPDEAAKLWAEFSDDGAEKRPEKTNGETVSDDFTNSQADENKDAASAGDGQEQADDAAKAEKQPDSPPPADDPWAKAPPELKAAYDAEVEARRKAENAARSDAGRVRSYQATIARLQGTAGAGKGAPATKKISEVLDEGLQEYPEIKQPVKDALAPVEQQLETLRDDLSRRDQAALDEARQHIRTQTELLDAAHPGWDKEYVTGPLAKAFAGWIQDQPKRIRDIVFVTNHDHIFDANGAIEVFDAFKTALTAAENPTPVPDGGQTQELSAKRAAQLDGSRSPKTPGGPPRVTGIPREGDSQSIWSAFPDDNADDRLTRRR